MGDVVTALARAVQEEGHHVQVVIPKYDCLDYTEARAGTCDGFYIRVLGSSALSMTGWSTTGVRVPCEDCTPRHGNNV